MALQSHRIESYFFKSNLSHVNHPTFVAGANLNLKYYRSQALNMITYFLDLFNRLTIEKSHLPSSDT